jgi:hypothetical protein
MPEAFDHVTSIACLVCVSGVACHIRQTREIWGDEGEMRGHDTYPRLLFGLERRGQTERGVGKAWTGRHPNPLRSLQAAVSSCLSLGFLSLGFLSCGFLSVTWFFVTCFLTTNLLLLRPRPPVENGRPPLSLPALDRDPDSVPFAEATSLPNVELGHHGAQLFGRAEAPPPIL